MLEPTADDALGLDGRALRFESLGDVLSELPGVSLIRQGGRGSTELVSIRGADFDHTTVLLDDVPIAGPDRGAVDLSLLPLGGFERIELYRGSAPLRYGMGSVGGVVRLVPRRKLRNQVRGRLGAGSFGTVGGRAEAQIGGVDGSFSASAGGIHADNDFEYLDDNATLTEADDRVATRQNADVDQVHAFASGIHHLGDHRLVALGMLLHQDRGLPGPATVLSLESRQQRTRLFASLGHRFDGFFGPLPAQSFATVGVGWDLDRVRDPEGKVGLGAEDTEDTYFGLDARTGLALELGSGLSLGLAGGWRYDDIQPFNARTSPGAEPSERQTARVGVEGAWRGRVLSLPAELRGSVGLQSTWAQLAETRSEGYFETRLNETQPTYRVELGVGPAAGLEAAAHLSSGMRVPTTLEWFGNRNTVVGSAELVPERSVSVDLGLTWRGQLDVLSVAVGLEGFFTQIDDIIVANQTSQRTITFENRESGTLRGLEGSLELALTSAVRSRTSATLLDATFDYDGFERKLPLRVPLRLFERLEGELALGTDWVALSFAELDYRGSFYADRANLVEQSPYVLVHAGLGAAFEPWGVKLVASARNLGDAQGLDLLAFPRPGRSFELTLEWMTEP